MSTYRLICILSDDLVVLSASQGSREVWRKCKCRTQHKCLETGIDLFGKEAFRPITSSYDMRRRIDAQVMKRWMMEVNSNPPDDNAKKKSSVKCKCGRPVRPLSDMTEEEMERVIFLIMDSEIHLGADARLSMDEVKGCIDLTEPDDRAKVIHFTVRCFIGKLYLSEHSGYLRLFNENDEESTIEWNPELDRFLLSKGFDLIDAGLAIDKTKMNQ